MVSFGGLGGLPTGRQGLMIQKMQRPIWIMQGFGRCQVRDGFGGGNIRNTTWQLHAARVEHLEFESLSIDTLTNKATRAPFVTGHRVLDMFVTTGGRL